MDDTKTESSETLSEEQLAALMRKYRPEINQVLAMNTEDQKKEFEKYGLSADAIMDRYRGLQAKSVELEYKSASVNTRSIIAGVVAFLATSGVFFAAGSKFSSSALVRWVMGTATSAAAGMGGAYIALRVLGQRVRQESKMLSTVAREVFDRELAVAMEKSGLPPARQEPATEAEETTVSAVQRSSVTPRESFVAEAAKEKAAAQNAGVHL